MSHCVPSWDIDENHTPPTLTRRAHSNSNSLSPDVPMLDYEVAELTWENGQVAMHGLGPPRVPNKPPASAGAAVKYTWDKPRAGGTLESIVNQATCLPHQKTVADELVPWFDHHRAAAASASASATVTMDALVPCSTGAQDSSTHALEKISTCVLGRSALVASCREANNGEEEKLKRVRVARVSPAAEHEWSSRDNTVSGSATLGRDSRQLTLDTCKRKLGVRGLTSTPMGSLENSSSSKRWTKATAGDKHDSVSHSRPQIEAGDEENKKKPIEKSSTSNKSRAAAVHNQSERKRRDKINQRMKTLQKMVPNSSKTDKASMLDEVIEYLKVLQDQVQMMSRMNMPMPSMMLPMAIQQQQQLQLSMMAPMGIGVGMGIGMGMDMNTVGRPNVAGIPPVLHPAAAFMPLTSWDGIRDRLSAPPTVMPDPTTTFLACQSQQQQPMNMEALQQEGCHVSATTSTSTTSSSTSHYF